MAKDSDVIKDALDDFRACAEAESDNRDLALQDLRFWRLSEQWDEQTRSARGNKRPCLTFNRGPSFIRQVVNDARQNRPMMRVHPVDSQADKVTAEILQGMIYSTQQVSRADIAYDTAIDFAASMGWGYFRITVDYAHDDSFDLEARIKAVTNPFAIYGDPKSMSGDSSDWNVAFVRESMDREDFEAKYPDANPTSFESGDKGEIDPDWSDGDRIVTAEYWTRDESERQILLLSDQTVVYSDVYEKNRETFDQLGLQVIGDRITRSYRVMSRIISGSEVLSETPWQGRYIPIIPVYGEEVMVEGKRHLRSLVRDIMDSQRNFNYWRSTTTELVAMAPRAPWVGPVGAFTTDTDKWLTANTQNHAFLEFDGPQKPEREPFAGPPAGALQEAANMAEEMKAITGIFDAALGNRSNEVSGMAIKARKRESDTGTFHFIDNQSRAIRHGACVLLDLYPHIYTGPSMVRILGGPGNDQMEQVAINQPTLYQGMHKVFDISVGKYDVVASSGPSYTTKREDAAEQMMMLVDKYPQVFPVIGDLLVKNLDWPGADEIAGRLRQSFDMSVGQNPQLQQLQQQMQQMQQAYAQREQSSIQTINDLQARLTQMEQDKILESRKLDIQEYQAETKLLDDLSKSMMIPDPLRTQLLQMVTASLMRKQAMATPIDPPPPPGQPPMPMQDIPPQPMRIDSNG